MTATTPWYTISQGPQLVTPQTYAREQDVIRLAQRVLGVTADGVIGPRTITALVDYLERQGPSMTPQQAAVANDALSAVRSLGAQRRLLPEPIWQSLASIGLAEAHRNLGQGLYFTITGRPPTYTGGAINRQIRPITPITPGAQPGGQPGGQQVQDSTKYWRNPENFQKYDKPWTDSSQPPRNATDEVAPQGHRALDGGIVPTTAGGGGGGPLATIAGASTSVQDAANSDDQRDQMMRNILIGVGVLAGVGLAGFAIYKISSR